MTYDFDKIIQRRGTNCVKWDEVSDNDTIPMWVADMDFETAPCIMQALQERLQHGCFGYTFVPESYYDATIQWFHRRHGWAIDRSSFIYTSGVVPAISAIIKAMTNEGDKVLVQTPVYNCFFSSIRNNGCILAENPLKPLSQVLPHRAEGVRYEVDWEDFEQKCADPAVKVFLLCNPHNPAGRVWTREELEKMGSICLKHGVFVISDEIHCEFTMPGHTYTPFASLSEDFAMNSAVCLSPSKAFNIAGLQIANIIVKDADIRKRVDKAININEVCDVNPFGVIALQAAYTPEGEAWLDELCQYIDGNYQLAKQMLEEALPHCPVTTLEGTYLLWLNIASTGKTSQQVADHLMQHSKVYVNPGTMYGETAGEGYIRINLATRRSLVEEGIRRIISGISKDINL
ncbi:MAG: pyridoxal phosphate-dependent aminotransferase [Bacteroidaceae bacterium]|nr:pyridoxal phosphate-dependent aminotransferase [Bacteroidaceae bacterium]